MGHGTPFGCRTPPFGYEIHRTVSTIGTAKAEDLPRTELGRDYESDDTKSCNFSSSRFVFLLSLFVFAPRV